MKDIIVITGGAGGIGTACAKMFKNYILVISDYSQIAVKGAVESLNNLGYQALGFTCDITQQKDVNDLAAFCQAQGKIRGIIHTAGVSGSVTDLQRVFDIDLLGTQLLIDAFYERATEGTTMVMMASMMGHVVPANDAYDGALRNPLHPESFNTLLPFVDGNSDTLYNFAKRGVLLMCQDNVQRWGQKQARIVTISPGVIETPMALKAAEEHPELMESMKKMTPLGKNGQPEDIAEVASFLVSDNARFITGSDILVDGGILPALKKQMANPVQ